MNAREIWSKSNTAVFSREERALAAMREITRLELAIAGWQHEIDTMEYRDDVPRHDMILRQRMQIGWATTDLASTRADLQTILKE